MSYNNTKNTNLVENLEQNLDKAVETIGNLEDSRKNEVYSLGKHQRQIKREWGHLFVKESKAEDVKQVPVIGWDTEFLQALSDRPQTPVTNQLAYITPNLPKTLQNLPYSHYNYQGVDFRVIEGQYTDIPYLLYAFTIPLEKLGLDAGYGIGFVFDARGFDAGKPFQMFHHACLYNVAEIVGLSPVLNEYHCDTKEKIKPDGDGNYPNTKLVTTYSNAEVGCLMPDLTSSRDYRRLKRGLDYKDDNKPVVKDIQGSRVIRNYLWDTPDQTPYLIDIIDTIHQGGSSVAKIGNTLGLPKVKGFNFNKYSATHYLETQPLAFSFYGFIDALISGLSEYYIHGALIKVSEQLANEGFIDDVWKETKGSKFLTREYTPLKMTSSGIGEAITEAMHKGQGVYSNFTGLQSWLDDNLPYSHKNVPGGLNQRYTDTPLPEFYKNINTHDFSAHYPTCLDAICESRPNGKFPIYPPKGVGFMRDTTKNLVERFSYLDYYELVVSFNFPENAPASTKMLLQNYNGEAIVTDKVESQLITPHELEYLALVHPDLKITVEDGYQWDREILESELKEGERIDSYYVDYRQLVRKLKGMRDRYKNESNHLMEIAVKLLMNSIYGKFAQNKDILDPESVDVTIANESELNSVGNKVPCRSEIWNPVIARGITGLGRAVTAWVAHCYDAVLSVTDSIAVTHDKKIDLQDCKTGYPNLDAYLNLGKIKHENPDRQEMAIITGVRGRILIPYDETLAKEIPKLYNDPDNQAGIEYCVERIREVIKDKKLPKFAKDGLKYSGDSQEQFIQCARHCLERYAGKTVQHTQGHLVKFKEVERGTENYVGFYRERTLTKDCIDPRSMQFKNYDDFLTIQKLRGRYKKDKKGLSLGELYRLYPDKFDKEWLKSRPRKRPSRSIPTEVQRAIAMVCSLKLVTQTDIAHILGVKKQSVQYWVAKMTKSGTLQHWVSKEKEPLNKALNIIGKFFNISFERKSKRSQKLRPVA